MALGSYPSGADRRPDRARGRRGVGFHRDRMACKRHRLEQQVVPLNGHRRDQRPELGAHHERRADAHTACAGDDGHPGRGERVPAVVSRAAARRPGSTSRRRHLDRAGSGVGSACVSPTSRSRPRISIGGQLQVQGPPAGQPARLLPDPRDRRERGRSEPLPRPARLLRADRRGTLPLSRLGPYGHRHGNVHSHAATSQRWPLTRRDRRGRLQAWRIDRDRRRP